MDAHAHLISLGWAGPGHALDSRPYKQKGHRGLAYDPSQATANTGNGLIRPLLISQRKGNLGIGKKAHEPQAGNDWWLKGFESALGNIGKSESERSSGTSTPIVHSVGKHGGLYSFFVKGQHMEGTIGKATVDESGDDSNSSLSTREGKKENQTTTSPRKRKADDGNGVHNPKSAKSSKKQKTAQDFEQVSQYIALRDQHEKRTSRPVRPSPVEEFRQVGEYLAARSEKSKKKKNKHKEGDSEANTHDEEKMPVEKVETKEERRERRRQRREDKAKRRAARLVNGEADSRPETELEEESASAKATRRAERKKRKADKAARNVEDT
ncbi:hypothetical protein PV10_03734 [Exophiala mesophila]|uniref:G-patch domain-containing protein n=1 Tax=Exophiala mesophila TaxID=212818 RepID=A0A0D1WTA5_EXOME|nr:uncharacterized protein PV10_03734 [Exophiala mesophila]KIV92435.1 hypothetical protein PV10_03734 [Exophiala mesophila]